MWTALGAGAGFGAIFGSFIATLAIRWPRGESVVSGRSRCDGCGRTLAGWELAPLVIALVYRGQCRTCGAPVDRLHPACEIAGAFIGASAFAIAPDASGVAGAAFGWLLLASAAIDWRAFWLPDRLTLALALGGVVTGIMAIGPPMQDRLIGGAAGFATLAITAWGYRRLRGREGLGGGDPKLLGAIGLWLGWQALPPVLVIASGTGLFWVFARMLRGHRVAADDRLPLGSLMAGAAFAVWLGMALRLF